jgi:glycolate oxidase
MNRDLAEALGRIVGPRWVRHRPAELATYAADGLPTHESLPGIVVLPGTKAEVAAVLRLLHSLGLPFVARGAGPVSREVRLRNRTPSW